MWAQKEQQPAQLLFGILNLSCACLCMRTFAPDESKLSGIANSSRVTTGPSYSSSRLATNSFQRLPPAEARRAHSFALWVLTGWPAVVLSVPSRLAARALPKAPAATTVDSTPLVPLACRVSLAPATAGVAVRLRASNAVPFTMAPAGQQGVI
jgi:hypothetical protein